MAAPGGESRTVVYAALAGNLMIAVVKFVAALLTGSSAMLTEGVHSLVDTINQALLLYGMARSKRRPDAIHPLGYGRELYFWSFVVALLIFSGGAGVSIYEGIQHIRAPEPIATPWINFAVLAFAFVFEGGSWLVAYRSFRRAQGDMGWWQALRRTKDPSTLVVLCEDSAALAGIVIAAAAIGLAVWLGDARYDGAGSILIGLLLGVVAILLARETKGLLIGERASPDLIAAIRDTSLGISGICRVNDVITVHLAPEQVVGIISIDFDDDLDTGGIERRVALIETAVRERYPQVSGLFVRPQSTSDAQSRRADGLV